MRGNAKFLRFIMLLNDSTANGSQLSKNAYYKDWPD